MAKSKTIYSCTECGDTLSKWQGQCPSCKAWNTLVETIAEAAAPSRYSALSVVSQVLSLAEVEAVEDERVATGISELDRVLGGGVVKGGVVLIGGDPGIGKSTLLLQALALMGGRVPGLYVSGEESLAQIAGRASRLGLPLDGLTALAETGIEKILAQAAMA
ncbi:MAG: ATPase domain-containing protein, partial [Sulfuriferula sp.]